jgi:thymidylate synthase (FAD)
MRIKLLGTANKKVFENQIRIVASAGRLSRFSGKVFQVFRKSNNYNDNVKFIEKVIGMGHTSIMDHDYLVFGLEDVTPIVEQVLISYRFTSFTIKSRREVDFRNAGFLVPDFRDKNGNIHSDNERLKKIYTEYMQNLFKQYGYFVDNGIGVEDARFILPYAYFSNIIMGMDATELARLTQALLYGKLSEIAELKEVGKTLLSIIEKRAPYMLNLINSYKASEEPFMDFQAYKEENNLGINILKKPELVSYTENPDDRILTSFFMGKYQCDRDTATKILNELSEGDNEFKNKLMKYILSKEGKRELEQVNFEFQIPISLAILTHLTRHRTHSLIIPDFAPMWDLDNYIMPDSIRELDPERYDNIFKKNTEMYEYFKGQGVREEDLVYFYLSGQMCNVLTNMDASTLSHFGEKRC